MKYKREDFPTLEEAREKLFVTEIDGEDICLIKCYSWEENLFIPYGVTVIGETSLKGYDYGPDVPEDEDYGTHDVESIIIPNTVKIIESDAFEDCECLHSIYIPESVTEIHGNPFSQYKTQGSAYLEIIEADWGNKRYRSVNNCLIDTEERLLVCGGMTAVIPVDCNIEKIGKEAFGGRYIEEVVIPEGVTEIGEAAFANCEKLRKISLPSTLKKIARSAFFKCKSLAEIVLPDGITEIGREAFSGCSALTEFVWSENITEIEPYTFSGCSSLVKIILPENLTAIGSGAFTSCGLREFTFPSQLKCVGERAFAASSITQIKLPSDIQFGSSVFYGCPNLDRVEFTGVWKNIPATFFSNSRIKEVILPEGVEEIKICAFGWCYHLKEINLPQSLKIIGEEAFYHGGLEKIEFPKNIKSVGYCAFGWCDNLKEITIPPNVVEDKSDVFCRCEGLERIVVEEGVKSIEKATFEGCINLKEVTLPDSLEFIGSRAFSGCRSLTEIELPQKTKYGHETTFHGCGIPPVDELAIMDMTKEEYDKYTAERRFAKINIKRR